MKNKLLIAILLMLTLTSCSLLNESTFELKITNLSDSEIMIMRFDLDFKKIPIDDNDVLQSGDEVKYSATRRELGGTLCENGIIYLKLDNKEFSLETGDIADKNVYEVTIYTNYQYTTNDDNGMHNLELQQ